MENTFKGMRVVELASVLAGPSVGMFMAELGAEVIKVENRQTQGDVTRGWKLSVEGEEEDRSAYFCSVNWGKKSIGLDLKDEADRSLLYRLVKASDFVISSFIPGKAQKLGVDSEYLMELQPGLICAEVNGYGEEVEKAAFDAIIQGEAGFTYINGEGENIYKMPVALMDVLAAHQLKEALLLAYIRKLQTGQGQRVSVSLLESGISALVNQANNWLMGGIVPRAKGSDHPNIVPYGTMFRTSDGKKLILAVGNDRQFEGLCEILGVDIRENWRRNKGRVGEREKIKSVLNERIRAYQRDVLLELLAQKGIPSGPIHSMEEVFDQTQAKKLIYRQGRLRGLRSAVFLPQTLQLLPPPHFNEHGEEVRKYFA